jgi:hypothetical protein
MSTVVKKIFSHFISTLMKYSEVVCDLAACGADCRFYDTQFRLLRQSNPLEFPWGSTHWELWICDFCTLIKRTFLRPSTCAQQSISKRTLGSQGVLSQISPGDGLLGLQL